MHMRNTAILAFAFAMLLLEGHGFAQLPFTYLSIDVPNSTDSWAMGIAPGGAIVGGYMGSADGREHGYLYDKGVFTIIDVPGSLAGLADAVTLEGEVTGINPAGDMVGDYFAPPGAPGAPACVTAFSPPCHRGFLYRHGQFSNVLVPGHLGTIASSIAPDGSIYGCLHDQTLGTQMFGFVRTPSGDDKVFSYDTLQSGGGELSDPNRSVPNSMNNAGTPDGSIIVGLYTPAGTTRAHGYIVRNGAFGDYVFPGSLATQIWGINPTGDFVGLYRILNAGTVETHGFLQLADGSAPMALNYVDPITGRPASQTAAFAINPAGAIVGFYLEASGHEHAFVAMPADR
jgi:hypothetical protein